jgi:YVTN family beta-propeller protein
MSKMSMTRRALIQTTASAAALSSVSSPVALAQQSSGGVQAGDRVFICNEDSNTLSVIDPRSNTIDMTINLTGYDEDLRPPFRYATGGVAPTHAAMVQKPLYHGAISLHGAGSAPDDSLLAVVARGTSNIYLIDTRTKKVIGGRPNPQANQETNPELLTTGILVGREPHEATFTRNGKEIWITVRGEARIAILDAAAAKQGRPDPTRSYFDTVNGPAMVWFSADGKTAFIASQKASAVDVIDVNPDANGASRPSRSRTLDITAQDQFGFTPFLKAPRDGAEIWLAHKLADAVSALETHAPFRTIDAIPLGGQARTNHVEFAENAQGKVVYATFARVDDNGPDGVPSSRIAIIDRSSAPGRRKVVGNFFSHGREAHSLWVNPENTLLYVSHEQDELPNTPNAGQTVCTAFDISDPFKPRFVAQMPLGDLPVPSGRLRNKKSIALIYVRPGGRSQTA